MCGAILGPPHVAAEFPHWFVPHGESISGPIQLAYFAGFDSDAN